MGADAARPRRPVRLRARGRRLWDAVVDMYELSDVEVQVLTEACRTVDVVEDLDRLQRTVDDAAARLAVLRELRLQRASATRLLGSLDLPDGDGVDTPERVRARKAADVRWDNGRRIRGGTPSKS